MIKAIETRYKGYRFRSRLEARWAVFFDALKIPYDYEPEGFDLGDGLYYLPDFWLPKQEYWIEIKGKEPSHIERTKAYLLSRGLEQVAIIAYGNMGAEQIYYDLYAHTFKLDVFCGDFNTMIKDGWIDHMTKYRFNENNLPKFLREQLKTDDIIFDGTKESAIKIIEKDKKYFYNKHGHEHPKWKYGDWYSDVGFVGSDLSICGVGDVRKEVAQAIYSARSARFEHGESP